MTDTLGATGGVVHPPPRISVVTVVRNDIAGLRVTAASVAAQQYPHVEHVVVDGASSDDCHRWPDLADTALPLVFRSEPDSGLYDAMNKGIALSGGELLLFLNAGDLLKDPGVLAVVAADYQRNGWLWGYGATDRWVGDRFSSHADRRPFDLQRMIAGRFWVPHQAAFFTRTLLDRVGGYDLAMGIAADQELMIRCGLDGPPATWSATIADFQNGGLSEQISFWQHEREWLAIRRKLVDRSSTAHRLDWARTAGFAANITARRAVKRARRRAMPGRYGHTPDPGR